MSFEARSVPHPGAIIEEELTERGWSQVDLAYILGGSESTINKIIAGRQRVTPEMAKALAVAFDVHPEFFANLQKAHDLANAKEPDPSVSFRARVQSVYPVRDMIKRGWIEDGNDSEIFEAEFCQFFGAKNLDHVPRMPHVSKKSTYDETPPQQIAWLFRAKQLASAIPIERYSEKRLRNLLPELHSLLISPEEIRRVPRLLHDVGVRYVAIEPLPRSKIDGVCFWLDGWSPVIGMSLRFDRIDNFWFVLRHEIEHVLRKDGKSREVIDAELEGANAGWDGGLPPQEREANRAATNFIVLSEKLDDFVARVRPIYSENRILMFARSIGVHPGLVVGQLQYRGEIRYSNFRKHLARVRNIITATAFTDGWGNASTIYQ